MRSDVPLDAGWIEAIKALNILTPVFGEERSKVAIATRLRTGRLKAEATELLNFVDGGNVQYAPGTDAKIDELHKTVGIRLQPKRTNPTLAMGFWKSSVDWAADLASWNWWDGCFLVTTALLPLPQRFRARGVRFLADDFADPSRFRRYLPKRIEIIKEGLERSPKWDWEAALIDLVAHVEFHGMADFQLGTHGGQTKLEVWLSDRIGRDAAGTSPSVSEVKKRAQRIKRAIAERKALI